MKHGAKERLSTALGLGVVLMCAATARAAQIQQTVSATATISDSFGFTIDASTPMTFTLGPGGFSSASHNILLACHSNHGRSFQINLAGGPLSRVGGIETIGGDHFVFWHIVNNGPAGFEPKGTLIPGFGFENRAAMAPGGQVVYQSDITEGSDDLVRLGFDFQVAVPAGQVAGNYTTTIYVTMAD